jgi:hypothetical protein
MEELIVDRKKKLLFILLALALALSMAPITTLAYTSADWAKPEIENAQSYGLIPDVLKDADLTRPITRAEFAAVAVKAYENFTGTTAAPVASNPFTDTSNTDVLKAYSIGIVNGTSATTYNPDGILTRQDAATLLTRVEKKAYIPGWTILTDSNYTLNFTQPSKFADDGSISDYARQSVYFMNAKGVINGTGNNNFSPTVTAARQEALIIAVRMVEKLKGVTLDYRQTGTPEPPPPPSGGTDAKLVGTWVRSIGTSDYRYYLSFKDDGSYSYVQISGSTTTTVTGRYAASGGRVYLTKLVDDMDRGLKDQSMGYSFGTDSDGEYLSIATVWFALAGTDEEPQEMSPTQFWRSR